MMEVSAAVAAVVTTILLQSALQHALNQMTKPILFWLMSCPNYDHFKEKLLTFVSMEKSPHHGRNNNHPVVLLRLVFQVVWKELLLQLLVAILVRMTQTAWR